eukprot:CAMPEP_0177578472 /NCGR_PEP_ID=MMETSP0419_2-20121207/367_1 /TAXON_ID=582737 /ORGANISM="Tetraselmis sp., Strain GSL018" /LENGTH=128 /DNA_ID=CAMNT_0019066919 /DNA_START=79 /DNA_END=465 /DNA_ORIENTATION=-
MKCEVEMDSPEDLVPRPEEAPADDEAPESEAAGSSAEANWKDAVRGMTGDRLKSLLKSVIYSLEAKLQSDGCKAGQTAMSCVKRHVLHIPKIEIFLAGAKVSIIQPDDHPLLPVCAMLNPDIPSFPHG